MFCRKARAERDFWRERTLNGDWSWVGRSSDELVLAAVDGREPRADHFPLDSDDLARCEQTYKRAPRHLKSRMRPILRTFRQHVREREDSR